MAPYFYPHKEIEYREFDGTTESLKDKHGSEIGVSISWAGDPNSIKVSIPPRKKIFAEAVGNGYVKEVYPGQSGIFKEESVAIMGAAPKKILATIIFRAKPTR